MSIADFWQRINESNQEHRAHFSRGPDNFYFSVKPLVARGHFQVDRYEPLEQEEKILHTYRYQTHFNLWLNKLQTQGYQLNWLGE